MRVQAILDHLDDDLGTGHSFYDPFIKDDVEPTRDNVYPMIEAALEAHSEFRDDRNRPTPFALNAARFLKRFNHDKDFAEAATEEACAAAARKIDEWRAEFDY